MPFELWGATNNLGLFLPDRPLGYSLLTFYLLGFIYLLYLHRTDFAKLTSRQWIGFVLLAILSFITSQLFPIHFEFNDQLAPLSVAQNPVTTLALFSAVPFLLAGALLNPVAALLVGAMNGIGHSLGQSHQVFDIFHFAFVAYLAAGWLQQNYLGRLSEIVRQPLVSGIVSNGSAILLIALAVFVSAERSASNLAALDLALSTASANLWPLLIEGAVGGAIVTFILQALPQLRPIAKLVPSPPQRNLRKRLLNNFVRFALLLTVLLLTVVFNISVYVSTRLVVNQMAHDANTVSAQVPDFQAHLQNLLSQYNNNAGLLSTDVQENQKTLRQLFRTTPFYRRILLVNPNHRVTTFYPTDTEAVALTDLEQTAVAQAFSTDAPNITPAQSNTDEYILSFIVPVLDQDNNTGAVLVGRVPELSLDSLIVGLQGTVGKSTGFIVDDKYRVIAHADANRLLTYWNPPDTSSEILTGESFPGKAFQGRQENTNARELVYFVTSTNPAWTVVITVPYEVVLRLALSIGWPLALVLLVFTAVFYYNLDVLGREITKPITELAQISESISAGGSLNMPIDTQRTDEIGQLGRAFAQMQRALQKRLDELSLLLSTSHDIASSMDINQSMPVILQSALRGTGASGARAVVFNPSGGHPLTFGEGPAANLMAVLDRPIMGKLRDMDELVLSTLNQVRGTLETADAHKAGIPSLIAIAIRSQDRFQGILWVGYRQPMTIGSSERNLLQTLTGQASILVENARLFATAEGGRRRLAAVLASTSDAVIVTDQTDRVLLVNPSMEKAFSLKGNNIIGRPVADVIGVEALVTALIGKDDRSRNLEIPMEDGKVYYTSASTIIRNDGQVLGRVAVLHDITHFKEIDQMKSDFVSTVSHDLRSPLTFMRGYSTMLPMVGELNDKQKEYIEKILSGIDQMSKLVDDLLDLSRIEAGVNIRLKDVFLRPLLEDIVHEHQQHASFSGINLQGDIPEHIPPIKGDEALIRQAITNLVTNGIKYAPNSGVMKVKAVLMNGEIIITVQDRGPGIPQNDQMRLFEKFFRVQQKGTEKIKGSGLGLAIVKSIAERHGGRVWCQSQVGQGSTFGITLPLAGEE